MTIIQTMLLGTRCARCDAPLIYDDAARGRGALELCPQCAADRHAALAASMALFAINVAERLRKARAGCRDRTGSGARAEISAIVKDLEAVPDRLGHPPRE